MLYGTQSGGGRRALRLAILILSVLWLRLPANADTATVQCGATPLPPGAYATIGEAVNALTQISLDNHVINVFGNCREWGFQINSLQKIRIVGQNGATLSYPEGTLPSPFGAHPLVNVYDSSAVEITGLTITGRSDAIVDLVRVFSSRVSFQGCVIQNGGADGMFLNNQSNVRIWGGAIKGHAGAGISVRAGTLLNIGDNNLNPGNDVVVQNNQRAGISASQNAHFTLGGNVSVLDNGGPGLSLSASSMFTCCETGQRLIKGNGAGINATFGSRVLTWGPLTVEDNRGHGVSLRASFAQINGDGGAHSIRNNAGYGILVQANGHVTLRTAALENNAAGGIIAVDNSSASLVGAKVLANLGDGAHARAQSVIVIGSPAQLSGNRGWDLYCTPESLGRGVKDGIGRMSCPGFNTEPDPDPGPADKGAQ